MQFWEFFQIVDWKKKHISELVQFKPVVFKGQLFTKQQDIAIS